MTTKRAFTIWALTVIAATAAACAKTERHAAADTAVLKNKNRDCAADNGGLTLPPGFCATIFADSIGHARHAVVNSNGVVYVNTWSGVYYGKSPLHPGGFIVALRDTNGDGRADIIARFGRSAAGVPGTPVSAKGPGSEKSGAGGTGIGLYKGYLYVEEGPSIVRYALASASPTPTGPAEIIVTGLPLSGDHPMHPFAIDSSGSIYIDLGSASDSCQLGNRLLESRGHAPCTELLTRGGVWRYDANKTNQRFSPGERYATGIRNAVGMAIGPGGVLYTTQHGRDQLYENWPKLYTAEQGQNLPAEELLRIENGADYGWPNCYYDNAQRKLVLAPEYGGDGGKAVGDCASKSVPAAFFPAHWAPDGLAFYSGKSFPARYQGGAFIAFHGSWNRAPGPQGGYQVAFVPFTGGSPTKASAFEKFADGFAGGKMDPDAAAHRPAGVAQGPDGSLYVTDDKAGRVWRIIYTGGSR